LPGPVVKPPCRSDFGPEKRGQLKSGKAVGHLHAVTRVAAALNAMSYIDPVPKARCA